MGFDIWKMIPVTQTKVVVKNSKGEMVQRGNCYAAAIASLLNLPITEVPNVEVLFHIEGSFWAVVMMEFLKSHGLEEVVDNRFKIFHDLAYQLSLSDSELERIYKEIFDDYYMVSGASARGVQHVCIYREGHLVHDPHPSRDGLLSFDYFTVLRPIDFP